MGAEEGGGAGGGGSGDLFGGALGDDFAAGFAAFRAGIQKVVGFGQNVEVMLDDDDGVAGVHQPVEEVDETADVGEVETDGRFFEKKEVPVS